MPESTSIKIRTADPDSEIHPYQRNKILYAKRIGNVKDEDNLVRTPITPKVVERIQEAET